MGTKVPNYHPNDPDYGKDLVYAHDGVREMTKWDRLAVRSMTTLILALPTLLFGTVVVDIILSLLGVNP